MYDVQDILTLQILAKVLQLDESIIPFLCWYSKSPVIINGTMCYQLLFKGECDMEAIIKKYHHPPNLLSTERLDWGWSAAAYFRIPE